MDMMTGWRGPQEGGFTLLTPPLPSVTMGLENHSHKPLPQTTHGATNSMKARVFSYLAAAAISLGSTALAANDEDKVQSLFNGKDLSGWDGDKKVWSVEDGAITGRNTAESPIQHNTFLVWQAGELSDFELELEYRIVDGNSGIQYRSQLVDKEEWIVHGYQADFAAGKTYSGILYDEGGRGILVGRGQLVEIDPAGKKCAVTFADTDELQTKIHHEQWNRYKIYARGGTLRHFINGQLMSETRDGETEHRDASGILALQVHAGPPMTVQFRDIQLKRLPPAPKIEDQSAADKTGRTATPIEAITAPPGFQIELIYSVPARIYGSWVCMTPAPDGSLTVSDESGNLYSVHPPAIGADPESTRVQRMNVPLGMAQGMVWAHDSLYVMVNKSGGEVALLPGLYRIRDTDGDGHLDTGRLLKDMSGAGEHGTHAVIAGPAGNDIYVVAGNHTPPIQTQNSLVPKVWNEDQLLPRMWDAGGHAVGVMAPGGWIARTDPAGKSWEMVSIGFRNTYDIAFDKHGELFTYDADMEWDIGAPWYRPTRVCHVTSGSEFGWRSGTGKWPSRYPDSLPSVVDVGPGSPTGIVFGYGAQFPEKYQEALYLCDWSFGKLYAAHLEPSAGSYRGELEDFVTGAPLPLTDVVIHPTDGAMYFTIGGRGTQSGLYRVTYVGAEPIGPPAVGTSSSLVEPTADAKLRKRLERFHGKKSDVALDEAWPYLDHPDRHLRYAARIAIEFQPVETWQERALTEKRSPAMIETGVALARHGDPQDSELPLDLYENLARLDWDSLTSDQRLGLLRVYGLAMIRLSSVNESVKSKIAVGLAAKYPSDEVELNQELCRVLVYLQAPGVVGQTLELLREALSQEEKIHYIFCLRTMIGTATAEQQREYFQWFTGPHNIRGGHSLLKFLDNIKSEAVEQLDPARRTALAEWIESKSDEDTVAAPQRPLVKDYSVEDVVQLMTGDLHDRNYQRGRTVFAAAQCIQCHRVGHEGGATGPDLTTVARRFDARYLAETIVEPNKVISDRFRATRFELNDGRIVTGRIANLNGDQLMVITDMAAPGDLTNVQRSDIESAQLSDVSVMPEGLLDTFDEQELLDLLAFLHAGGDPESSLFARN
jgi:putative heme-binding domain-containing protein